MQVAQPSSTIQLSGAHYSINNDGSEFADRIFGAQGALARAVNVSTDASEKTALAQCQGQLLLRCRRTVTLDASGPAKTVLHCFEVNYEHTRRHDFVGGQWEQEYPSRLEAIFPVVVGGVERVYVVVRTMQIPAQPSETAVLPFSTTRFDANGLFYVVPAATITRRLLLIPDVDVQGKFYLYPEDFPDVLGDG